jgi:hypothetical protein
MPSVVDCRIGDQKLVRDLENGLADDDRKRSQKERYPFKGRYILFCRLARYRNGGAMTSLSAGNKLSGGNLGQHDENKRVD